MTPALTQAFDWIVFENLCDAIRPMSALVMQRQLAQHGVCCGAHDVQQAFVRLMRRGLAHDVPLELADLVPRFEARLVLRN